MTKAPTIAATLIVAFAALLVLAPSFGVGTSAQNAAPAAAPTAVLFALAPDLPRETPTPPPTRTPEPTNTPQPTWTPQPPQIIYVQVPPQTIYLQAPSGSGADSQSIAAPPPAAPAVVPAPAAAPAASPCHASYSGVCLDATAIDYDCIGAGDGPYYAPGPFRVIGEDVFALDSDFNGIGCDLPSTATVIPTATLTPTRTPTRTPEPTRTPRPTATPVLTRGQIVVNFAGAPIQKPTTTVNFAVAPGTKAWDAIRTTIGASNLSYQDFGGELGVFIDGFYGVKSQGNHFWEFFVNGQSSSIGISGYTVGDGDVLEFRYSSF